MDHAMVEARRKACKDGARVVVAIAMMFMLVWILNMGYKLATGSRSDYFEVEGYEYDYIVVVFGVATVICGMVYFIIGLTIVVELALDLLAWLQGKDVETSNNQEKEEKTICQVCIQAIATIVSMFMLGWAIYYGCKLATGAPKGGIHNCLAFVIGFTAMAFGFIYFIIGISIVAEPAMCLSARLQQKLITENDIHEDKITDPLLAV